MSDLNRKALLVYFSQQGSTKKIAEETAKGLIKGGYQVEYFSLGVNPPPLVDDYSLIGIATPVYAYHPPYIVMDFIKKIKSFKDKNFFVAVTYGTYPGPTVGIIRNMLQKKGGRYCGAHTFKGEDWYYGYLKEGYLFSPQKPDEKEFSLALRFGESIALNASNDYYHPVIMEETETFADKIAGLSYSKLLLRHFYPKLFRVDKKKCTQCGLCLKKCPTHNITKRENFPVFHSNCIGCQFCEMYCPVEAIKTPLYSNTIRKFVVKNVAKAMADPSIGHQIVKLEKGHLQRF